jgi:integrase
VWRPALGRLPFQAVQYSMMVKVADSHRWNRKTYNNAISALRRAFAFGYLDYPDYPDRVDPATRLRSARIGKKDRPRIDSFSIQDAEVIIAALHQDWGEAHGNYEEFRFIHRASAVGRGRPRCVNITPRSAAVHGGCAPNNWRDSQYAATIP